MTECRCRWCGHAFMPRTGGGKPQTFCRPAHRRAYDHAGRRYVAAALADGTLTVGALRSGYSPTPAFLSEVVSPTPGAETEALLDELLAALLSLPPDELSWLVYYRLPGEVPLSARSFRSVGCAYALPSVP
jgi:hypothetical protein